MALTTLLEKVKANLIISHSEDDELIQLYITAAIRYAESYQHLTENYYDSNIMPATTSRLSFMLSSHFYKSRDAAPAAFYRITWQAGQQVWNTVNTLLRIERN